VILTRPRVTGWLLLGMILGGVALSVLCENRVFCRYVCPVGGFIGLYSLTSTIELGVKDTQICLDHETKDRVVGTPQSYGCPWMVFPGNLERDAYCGLCTECLKACPRDNIAVNLRPFGADLLVAKGRSLDEAYKALIMLGCALLYSAVLLGPWGWVKDWANMATIPGGAAYAMGFLAITVAGIPAVFWLATLAARQAAGLALPVRRLFVDYAYCLVPLGLTGWIAFTAGFLFVNGSYIVAVPSDPFGWGWDLFGTRSIPGRPVLTQAVAVLQTGVLLVWLVYSVVIAYRIGRQHARSEGRAWRGTLPLSAFLSATTLPSPAGSGMTTAAGRGLSGGPRWGSHARSVVRGAAASRVHIDPVPREVGRVRLDRDRPGWMPVPSRVLVAGQVVPHLDDREQTAHCDVIAEGARGALHRDRVPRIRHDLGHPAHVHARCSHGSSHFHMAHSTLAWCKSGSRRPSPRDSCPTCRGRRLAPFRVRRDRCQTRSSCRFRV
jgi:hypothetical protein